MAFKELLAVQVNHEYAGGPYANCEFILPAETDRILRGGRLLPKRSAGRIVLLYESDDAGDPLVRIDGRTLMIGLKLLDGHWPHVTALPDPGDRSLLRTGNTPDPRALAPLTRIPPKDDVLSRDAYRQLVDEGAMAILDLQVTAAHYTTPARFVLPLQAQRAKLRYYVVARNYTPAEIAELSVGDTGDPGDGDPQRPRLAFNRIPKSAFGAGELPVELLEPARGDVVLFESQTAIVRKARALEGLQLNRNGTPLIKQLPLPGPSSPGFDVIVHLSKP